MRGREGEEQGDRERGKDVDGRKGNRFQKEQASYMRWVKWTQEGLQQLECRAEQTTPHLVGSLLLVGGVVRCTWLKRTAGLLALSQSGGAWFRSTLARWEGER